MDINKLVESLSIDEINELKVLLLKQHEKKNLTLFSKCLLLEVEPFMGKPQTLGDWMSVRLKNIIKNNAKWCDDRQWYFETIEEKELRKLRNLGGMTLNEFLNLRDEYLLKHPRKIILPILPD